MDGVGTGVRDKALGGGAGLRVGAEAGYCPLANDHLLLRIASNELLGVV